MPTPPLAKSGGYYLDDGPEAVPPPNLKDVSNAVPRAEAAPLFSATVENCDT